MGPNLANLGFQPASMIGNGSIGQTLQEYTTMADLLSAFSPGAIQNSNNGKTDIRNTDGSIVSGQGLTSTTNFPSGNVVDSSSRNINSKTEADINFTLITFDLAQQSRVFIGASIILNLYNMLNSDVYAVTVWVNIDGVDDSNFMYMQSGPIIFWNGSAWQASPNNTNAVSITNTLLYNQIKTLNSGTHFIKLRWALSSNYTFTNSQGAITTDTSVFYIVLGGS